MWQALTIAISTPAHAQDTEPEKAAQAAQAAVDAGVSGPDTGDAGEATEDVTVSPPAEPEPPRGDDPVSAEAVVRGADPRLPAPDTAAAQERDGRRDERAPAKERAREAEARATAPLVVWATANWAHALGAARCGSRGLQGTETAIRIASTLAHSLRSAGLGVAVAGALGDHPLLTYAAHERPQQLAELLSEIGFAALVLGVADLNGPLLREPALTEALEARGVVVIGSNLECGGQPFCEPWATAEDAVPIVERHGRRYALFSAFPDDLAARVEPAGGRRFGIGSARSALLERTRQARARGADLIIASVDHGPDASASAELAELLSQLPPEVRPDLLFSPSAADNLLFMRPLDVQPAVVGTRTSVLTGVRVTKLPDSHDSDVFARSVRLNEWDDEIARKLTRLGADYCRAQGAPLRGGRVRAPMAHAEYLAFAAQAARAVAGADLAVIDPAAYDPGFAIGRPTQLERGQVERSVVLDAPLVEARVTLDWLGNLGKRLEGLRPLVLVGSEVDQGTPLIAGRVLVPGALYRIVTSSVLARSGRLPDGASWAPVGGRRATLRAALLAQLDVDDERDPRARIPDPAEATQWVLRTDGQLQASLTAVSNPGANYDDPGLLVSASRQLGVQLLVNFDGDARRFLFENRLQVGFDRNFVTDTSGQDLVQLESTYTYRGLWSQPLLYPHPFVEGYVETQFLQGDAAYHPLLLRPEVGVRSMFSRTLSLKASVGFEYRAFDPERRVDPGIGAEVLLKPSTLVLGSGPVQIEGNITYYWNSPGSVDQHTLRGQVIGATTLFGPLQFTVSALGTLRKDRGVPLGKGFSTQLGLRVRLVERSVGE